MIREKRKGETNGKTAGIKGKAFRAAFPFTLPICAGFLFLGLAYGVYMNSKGFPFAWPMIMILTIFAGSMEFVTVTLLTSAFIYFIEKRRIFIEFAGAL